MPTPLRKLRPQAVAIILTSISIVTLISLGEIFELFSNKKEPLEVVKRDGSTIEFALPWRHLVNYVEAASLDQASGSNLEPGLTKGTAIPDTLENDRSKLVSVDVSEGMNVVSIVASILNEGSAVLSVVVENGDDEEDLAASLTVGSSTISTTLSNEPGGNHAPLTSIPTDIQHSSSSDYRNSSPSYQLPSPPTNKIDPQTVSNGSPPLFKLNLTITPSFSGDMVPSSIGTPLQFLPPIPTACPPVVTPTCPEHVTLTCYVTETWHSTHYESIATFFSFMSAITVTETISLCPQSNPYSFGSNTTTLHASPVPSRSFSNTNHTCSAHCAQSSANPASTESSVVFGRGGSYSYSSTRPISALFTNILTGSLPPKVNPQVSSNLLPTIRCADGSLEFLVENCLFGSPSSSLLAFRTSSLLGESTTLSFSGAATAFPVASHTATQGPFGALGSLGTGGDCLTSCFPDQSAATSLPSSSDGKVAVGGESFIAGLASVLGSIPGLNGGLLSTVIAIISSGANELPTSGLGTLATSTDVGTSIVGHGHIEITLLNGGLEGGNALSTAVSRVTAGVGNIGLNGGLGDIGAAGSEALNAATENTNNVIGNGNLFPTAALNAKLVFGASAGNQPTIAGATQVAIENGFPGLGFIRNVKHDVETSTGILLVPPESLRSDSEREAPWQPNIPSKRPFTLITTIITSPSPSGSLPFASTSNTIESLRRAPAATGDEVSNGRRERV